MKSLERVRKSDELTPEQGCAILRTMNQLMVSRAILFDRFEVAQIRAAVDTGIEPDLDTVGIYL